MSKIGNKPVKIADGVKVNLNGKELHFEGKAGKLSLPVYDGLSVDIKDGLIFVKKEKNDANALHGTMRAKIQNAVLGVSEGFKKTLEISGVGFRAQSDGKKITMQLGFSHPVSVDIPSGIKVEIAGKEQNIINVYGIDKELVGNFADRIKKLKLPEPYKGSGIKYQNERILRKAGKAAAGSATGGAKK
ncbi:MAG: 50S ribosomal protein L6 [Elusimicrobiota bacterium]